MSLIIEKIQAMEGLIEAQRVRIAELEDHLLKEKVMKSPREVSCDRRRMEVEAELFCVRQELDDIKRKSWPAGFCFPTGESVHGSRGAVRKVEELFHAIEFLKNLVKP